MERCLSEALDDGFESDDEARVDIVKFEEEENNEPRMMVTEQMIRYVPPPQQIKGKSYSLHPDMMTGWAPKIPLPKPIPLTFPHDPIAEALNAYYRNKPSQITLAYLGPRFDNTYSAWRAFEVQFPYHYMGERRLTITDRRFQGMSPELRRQQGLKFQSMFQSGNLDAVFKTGEEEYDCFMRVDSNTRGHLQWYYFKLTNLCKDVVYHFNICNFQKAKTLYTRGMKPYIFSYRQFEFKGVGWRQGGENIEYSKRKSKTYANLLDKDEQQNERYFTLSFELSTPYQSDSIEIAYCPPYTFTKLNVYLKFIIGKHRERNIICSEHLCTSFGGFKLPLLTITNCVSQAQQEFKQEKPFKTKGLIFIMGRIHPGQANGSFMMEGFINWLCGFSREAEELRNSYVFKIIPMMNPDGVVMGNYRTGLSGRDFNREFRDPDSTWFVEISQLKYFLQRCKWIYQRKFQFFLDFHGHTVKRNSFTYGPEFPLTHPKYYESRIFPKLLSQKTNLFRYYSCVFRVTPCKSGTARAILLRQYGIPFVYTIEASNGSYFDHESKCAVAFDIQKWSLLGEKTCEALFSYWMLIKDIEQSRQRRKKEKQRVKIKNKAVMTRKIQSSSSSRYNNTPGRRSKSKLKIEHSFQQTEKNNILSQIINEITNQDEKDVQKCSDDQFSQGKSDSQNSEDDIDINSMMTLLNRKHKVALSKVTPSKNTNQKVSQTKELKIIKRTSFITEFEEEAEEPRNHPIFERTKRHPFIRRKIYTATNTCSSPQNKDQDSNGTAKIVNLSFMLHPVTLSNPMIVIDKKPKLKTQTADQYQGRQCLKQDPESYRRTFLSLQRQALKKEMIKRLNMQSNPSMICNQPFKFQEIVGKKIFSQS